MPQHQLMSHSFNTCVMKYFVLAVQIYNIKGNECRIMIWKLKTYTGILQYLRKRQMSVKTVYKLSHTPSNTFS